MKWVRSVSRPVHRAVTRGELLRRGRSGGKPGPDILAPVLSSPDVDAITETTATAHVTTSEGNGTLYIVITNNTTAPSAAQIKAGQDHLGAAATFADDVAVASAGVKSFNVTGLTAATQYWFYAIQSDAALNDSNITDYGPFETAAADIAGPTLLTWDTNGATGLRPVFTVSGLTAADVEVDDVINIYLQDSDDVTFALYVVSAAIVAGDLVADEIEIVGVDPIAEDNWQAHARVERAAALGDISNEVNFVVDLPSTPSLEITSAVTDNTPGGTFTGDLQEGDTAEVQYDTVDTFDDDPQTLQNVIDSSEDAADTFAFATSALADGTWHFRPRIVRPLYGPSAWGTSDSITIDTTVASPTLSPLDNATGVLVGANLTATFAENISFDSTVSITIKKTSDNSTVQAFTEADIGTGISIAGAVLTINPTSDLAENTEYYVQVDSTSIKDAAGNFWVGISSTTAWSFTTETGSLGLQTSLVAFWELEDTNWTDAVSTNDLTGSGTPTTTTGKVGNCVALVAASSQYLTIADNAEVGLTDSDTFSVQAWVNFSTIVDGGIIASKVGGFGEGEWSITTNFVGSNQFRFTVIHDGTNARDLDAGTFGALSTSTWYHVVATWDGTDQKIYINGTADTATPAATTSNNGNGPFNIGTGNDGGAGAFWSGSVDQVGLWKNRVLTADDVAALYNSGNGLSYAAMA